MASSSSLVRPSLLGGVDGVITSFAIVAGGHAGTLGRTSVLVIGLSSLAADGLSMGVSEYLSGGEQPDWRAGLACFASFVVLGLVPLVAYVTTTLLVSILLSLVCLAGLGALRGPHRRGRNVLQTLVLGTAAGGVAFGVALAVAAD